MNEAEYLALQARQKKRSRWRRPVLIAMILVVLLGIGVPIVGLLVIGESRLQKAMAMADASEPHGWRIADLEASRTLVPDDENTGLVMIQAKQALPASWPHWDTGGGNDPPAVAERRRQLQEGFNQVRPPHQLDPQLFQAIQEELTRAQVALDLARKMAALPLGRLPITYTKDVVMTLLPHTQDSRTVASLLSYAIYADTQKQNWPDAVRDWIALVHCSRAIGDEPTMISMLVRLAIQGIAVGRLEWMLSQGELPEEALVQIQKELEEEAAQPLLLIGSRGERAMIDGGLEAVQNGDLQPGIFFALTGNGPGLGTLSPEALKMQFLPGSLKRLRATLLEYNTAWVAIARMPVEHQVEAVRQIQGRGTDLPILAKQLIGAEEKVAQSWFRSQMALRCLTTLVAIERFRLKQGRWPTKLEELSPTFLKDIPYDIFDGHPYSQRVHYRRFEEGVMVYSVGQDGKDNGGTPWKKSFDEPGTDLVYRLWDVSRRRQAPRPLGAAEETDGR